MITGIADERSSRAPVDLPTVLSQGLQFGVPTVATTASVNQAVFIPVIFVEVGICLRLGEFPWGSEGHQLAFWYRLVLVLHVLEDLFSVFKIILTTYLTHHLWFEGLPLPDPCGGIIVLEGLRLCWDLISLHGFHVGDCFLDLQSLNLMKRLLECHQRCRGMSWANFSRGQSDFG